MKHTLVLLVLLILCAACEQELVKEEFSNTPEDVYDAFWTEFDRFYGAFEAKGINWDSLKIACGDELDATSTDRQIYDAICKLLASLNDGHADVSAPEFGKFNSWNRRNKSFFSDVDTRDGSKINKIYNTTLYTYLSDYKRDINSGYLFIYGTILYNSRKIGYLYIPTFSGDQFPKSFIKQAASAFNNMDAVIIDLRYNGGGETSNYLYAINLFSTERTLYFKSKFRNGKNHSDFTALYSHYSSPDPEGCKNKPIAILANSFTASSSEHFILGLKSQDRVILVGDTTCGAFSQVHDRILPNGWVFRLGSQVIYTPEGKLFTDSKGRYLEGNGLAPDYYVTDQYNKLDRDMDMPLNKALYEIRRMIAP
jgi:carboxyl-terminal processing protease